MRSKLNMGRIGWTSQEPKTYRVGPDRIKEPDPRGAGRPLEAYAPRLVGIVRVSVKCSHVSIKVLTYLCQPTVRACVKMLSKHSCGYRAPLFWIKVFSCLAHSLTHTPSLCIFILYVFLCVTSMSSGCVVWLNFHIAFFSWYQSARVENPLLLTRVSTQTNLILGRVQEEGYGQRNGKLISDGKARQKQLCVLVIQDAPVPSRTLVLE